MKESAGAEPFSVILWLWFAVAAGLAFNIAGWLLIGVLPDEAYYWVWSERLQAGYFDHPPLIAWLIRPFTALFGDNGPALRLPSVLGWFIGAACAWDLARRIYHRRSAALLALVIWTTLPIVQIGFHVNTPDTPLVLFAWGAFYFAVRALQEGRGGHWLLAGGSVGLAMAGKYPAVLIPAALFIGLAATPEGRRVLASRWPWLAASVAALVFLPVVWWNWRHDWISFAFQFHHGVRQGVGDPLPMFFAFLGGQLAVAMPWNWLAMAAASLPVRPALATTGRPVFYILSAGFWLPLILFGLAGLTAKSHPNWPVVAYVPGTLLLAGALSRWWWPDERRPSRWLWLVGAAALAAVLLVNLLRFPHWVASLGLQLPPQRTQLSQSYGWAEVGDALEAALAGREGCVVMADKLQTASMVALLLQDPDRVAVSDNTRFNQFHLWQSEGMAPPERLCLYLEQFEEASAIPSAIDLGAQRRWRLQRVIEHRNPDLSRRWSAFYEPEG